MDDVKQWLNNNTIGVDIWNKKYRYKNESFSEWLDRVSGGNDELRRLIKERKFLFGGRTLSNRGTDDGCSFFNCYSSGFAPDSYDGLLELNKNLGLTYKAQGGQGVSLSKLRPKGALIKNRYASDGIIPFMEIFNTTTKATSQGGARKGALMLSLDIRHKEAEAFIKIKATQDKIDKANLSLEIDDEFMKAVEKFYKTGEKVVLHEVREYAGNKIEYDIVPIELYKLLVENSYDWADPACLFTERFRNYNLMEFVDDYQIETSNPCGEQPLPKDFSCLTGDTVISTPNGSRLIKDLINSDNEFVLSTDNKFRKYLSVVSQGEKDVYEILFSNGLTIKATDNHKFLTDCGTIEVKDLKIGNKCKVLTGNHRSNFATNNETYEMFGWMHGDGWITKDAVGISFNNKDGDFPFKDRLLPVFKDYFNCENIKPLKNDEISYQIQITGNSNSIKKCNDLGFVFGLAKDRELPKNFYTWDYINQLSFIRGLFESDGNVQGKCNGQVWLYSSSINLMKQVQIFLSSIGIHSRYYVSNFTNGRNPQYKLGVSKKSSIIFMDVIGFNNHKKAERFNSANYKDEDVFAIKSIKRAGTEEVFDIVEVENTNTFYANGIAVHNCNLGSINLNEFVLYPYTEQAAFNLKDFKTAVRIGVEALDTVIYENADNHPLKEQKENSLNYRNIGLGVMGYANMLMKMGYEYGSKPALEFTKALFQTMFKEAIWESHNLAIKYGPFPKYSDKIFESTIIKECLDENFINVLKEHGIRNCSLLSIAPTGSISTMLGVSGGIEPEFALSYQRKTESLNDGKDKYYTVYCNSVNEYKEVNPGMETLPEYFISAAEIPWKQRVDTQAAIQNFVDTAISSTVNLPTEATLEDVENLYLYAWQKRIKGITIYRNGCKREAILTTNTPKPEQIEEKAEELENLTWGMTLQLSDDLIGKKRKIMSGCGSIHVSGWFDPVNGRLLEVFLSKGSSGGCNAFMTSDSRMISLALRTGADFDMVMDQLKSVPSCPSYSVRNAVYKDCSKGNNCSSAIANALIEMHNEIKNELFDEEEEYSIPAGRTEAIEQKKEHIKTVKVVCPECGADLQFAEGCNSCSSCGYSACS